MDTQGTAILARLLGRDARLDFNIALQDGDVIESKVNLRGAAITADASGTVRKGVLGYGANLNLSDLSRLSDLLRGSLRNARRCQWPPGDGGAAGARQCPDRQQGVRATAD